MKFTIKYQSSIWVPFLSPFFIISVEEIFSTAREHHKLMSLYSWWLKPGWEVNQLLYFLSAPQRKSYSEILLCISSLMYLSFGILPFQVVHPINVYIRSGQVTLKLIKLPTTPPQDLNLANVISQIEGIESIINTGYRMMVTKSLRTHGIIVYCHQ